MELVQFTAVKAAHPVKPIKRIWDKIGMVLSALCIVHCLGVVVFPLLLPAVAVMAHSPWVHRIFVGIVLFTTPMAFLPGLRRHGVKSVMVAAFMGVLLVTVGMMLEGHVSEIASHIFSIVGSIILVSAHALNIHHSRKFKCC